MTPKEYLQQLKHLESEVEHLTQELELAEKTYSYIRAVRCDSIGDVSGTKPSEAGFEKQIDRITDLKAEINSKACELHQKRHEIVTALGNIPDITQSRLLFMMYVEHKSIDECAVNLNLSYNYILMLRNKALKAIQLPAA